MLGRVGCKIGLKNQIHPGTLQKRKQEVCNKRDGLTCLNSGLILTPWSESWCVGSLRKRGCAPLDYPQKEGAAPIWFPGLGFVKSPSPAEGPFPGEG